MSGTDVAIAAVVSGPTHDQHRLFGVGINLGDGVSARQARELHQLVDAEAVLREKLLSEKKDSSYIDLNN